VLAMSTAIDLDLWARTQTQSARLGTVVEHPTARLGLAREETEG
jgi:flagellar protein FlbD